MRYIDSYTYSGETPKHLCCSICDRAVQAGQPVFHHFAAFSELNGEVGEHVVTHRDCQFLLMTDDDSSISDRMDLLQSRIDAILKESGEYVEAEWLVSRLLTPHVILSRTEMLESVKGIMRKVGTNG